MRRGAIYLSAALSLAACTPAPPHAGDATAEIEAMLRRSAADWNRGDLAAFMDDYVRDSMLSYVSGRGVQYGWQPLYDRYYRGSFAPGATRDSLTFTNLAVRTLNADLALATARFQLMRGDSIVTSGPFTLILEKRGTPPRWLIIHDHTSSDP